MKQLDRDAKYIGALLHAGKNDAAMTTFWRVSTGLKRQETAALRDKIHQHHAHLNRENEACVLSIGAVA